MFEIEGKCFRRKKTHYVTLQVTNISDRVIDGEEPHTFSVRPRCVRWGDESVTDPHFGRVLDVHFSQGEKQTLKARVEEGDLFELGGTGSYEIVYGVVHEFVRWFEPFYTLTIEVKEPECKELPSSQESQDKTEVISPTYSWRKDTSSSESIRDESTESPDS